MASIYLITRGEYSDYEVLAAYSTREAAETISDMLYDASVKEIELDPGLVELNAGKTLYKFRFDTEGNVKDLSTWDARQIEETEFLFSLGFECTLWADTRERAIKVANERRLQALARVTHCEPLPRSEPL